MKTEHTMEKITKQMKADSYQMAALSVEVRNTILANVKAALLKNQDMIFEANKKDMEYAQKNGIADSVRKRLKFDAQKLKDVTDGIDQLIQLPDPIGQTLIQKELDEGLRLYRISCPIQLQMQECGK